MRTRQPVEAPSSKSCAGGADLADEELLDAFDVMIGRIDRQGSTVAAQFIVRPPRIVPLLFLLKRLHYMVSIERRGS